MRVAALYDIHGNLPALEAVLRELRQAGVDQVVVGGDVVPGPMPRETLQRLLDLDLPVHFIHGNGELAILAQMSPEPGRRMSPEPGRNIAATDESSVTYWGTTSGAPPPEPVRVIYRWTAAQLRPDYGPVLAGWPRTLRLAIPGLGEVLFCHATPRSETELFTRLTAEERLLPLFDGLGASLVVCGHTHMQFDRMIGGTRVVNAGSVGEPIGEPGACWLLLGPDVELRRTPYDLQQAGERIRATDYPEAGEFAYDLLQPPPEADTLKLYSEWELSSGS